MKIRCFHSKSLHPKTVEALSKYAPDVKFIYTEPEDDYSYWREIKKQWTGEDDLLIIEQGEMIHESVIPQFESCPMPWCIFPFQIAQKGVWRYEGLGCTRFRKELQKEISVSNIKEINGGKWIHVEGMLLEACKEYGYSAHAHYPGVIHHHPGQDLCECC